MSMDPKLLSAVEAHASLEARNAVSYLNLYSAMRAEGWEGFSKKWKDEAGDELDHAQNFVKLAAKYNDRVTLVPPTKDLPEELGPKMTAQVAYDLELETENSMRALVGSAEEAGDAHVVEWISGKLLDQVKFCKQAHDFLQYVDDCEDGTLVLLDRQLENGNF